MSCICYQWKIGESVKLDSQLLAAFIKYVVGEKDIFIIDSSFNEGSATKCPSGSYEDWGIVPFPAMI